MLPFFAKLITTVVVPSGSSLESSRTSLSLLSRYRKTSQLVEHSERRTPLSDLLIEQLLQGRLLLFFNMRRHIVVHVASLGETVDKVNQLCFEASLALEKAEVISGRRSIMVNWKNSCRICSWHS